MPQHGPRLAAADLEQPGPAVGFVADFQMYLAADLNGGGQAGTAQ
ncbi:hypothetical protein RND61_02990 [Streptomyces sp. TRM76323]|uniref:Uncharacterized protein n=1 Tax=Streptomyces tamarix TaxID=3078565 RepID=A0ABU3QE70_9ACTN|nr:hypothetical protein [Streptomyces tamarix]MDT9681048.1 hypothetical protein [Streptomyces tamarix]